MEKEKIQNLISQMTLEEKAGMCSGADFWPVSYTHLDDHSSNRADHYYIPAVV